MDKYIKIGNVARALNISTRTIRYYEEIGLIESIRCEGSNYRMYDLVNINKLKQIIFFRSLQFSVEDVKNFMLSYDNNLKEEILKNKFKEVNENAAQLLNLKDILESALKVGRERGIENISYYTVLKEQIYINSKNEEVVKLNEKEILVEFGMGIVPYVDKNQGGTVIDNIKELRIKCRKKYNMEVPLIHLRDNESLENYEYRITIDNKNVFSGDMENLQENDRCKELLRDINNVLIKNKNLIEKMNNNCENVF